jgi:hypothetical protein
MGQVYGVQRDICCHGIETKLKSLINVERTIVTIMYKVVVESISPRFPSPEVQTCANISDKASLTVFEYRQLIRRMCVGVIEIIFYESTNYKCIY